MTIFDSFSSEIFFFHIRFLALSLSLVSSSICDIVKTWSHILSIRLLIQSFVRWRKMRTRTQTLFVTLFYPIYAFWNVLHKICHRNPLKYVCVCVCVYAYVTISYIYVLVNILIVLIGFSCDWFGHTIMWTVIQTHSSWHIQKHNIPIQHRLCLFGFVRIFAMQERTNRHILCTFL